jgi:hypothetical protein
MTRRQTLTVWIVLAVVFLVWFVPKAREFLAIDKCLDAGGAWNDAMHRCEH